MIFTVALFAVLVQQPPTNPTMTGTWLSDSHRLQIKLQGDSLAVTEGSQPAMVYRLDGSVSRNSSKTASGPMWKHESTARFVGNAVLIVTKTIRENGASWEWLSVYSIDAETGNLTVLTIDHAAHEAGENAMLTRSKSYRRALN